MRRQERLVGRGAAIRDDRDAHAAGTPAPAFDGDQHEGRRAAFQLSAPPNPGLGPANPCVIHFDVTLQGIARGIHHRPPELVEDQPRRFVAPQGQLPLHPQGRRAALVGDHQVGRPEPGRQRRLRVVQDRARRERHLMPTAGALPSPRRHPICAPMLAPRADESVRPATGGQVSLACLLGRELALKLVQILRKRRPRHPSTLQVVAC